MTLETRRLRCPWEEWDGPLREERTKAERERSQWHDNIERDTKDRYRIDPDRTVPNDYEQEHLFPESTPFHQADPTRSDQLREALRSVRGRFLRDPSLVEVARLFNGLPALLCRDLLAAAEGAMAPRRWDDPTGREAAARPGADTVATVLQRSVDLLLLASRSDDVAGVSAFSMFTETDADFVTAAKAEATARGGQLWLPPVPVLPPPGRYDTRPPADLGWVRLAFADTTGNKWHAVGCPTTTGRDEDPATQPLWLVDLAPAGKLCGVCGGPGLRHPLEVAHLLCAVDVWHARGRGTLEPWQRTALARLVAATMVDCARVGEPVDDLSIQIAAALSASWPGAEGWEAYDLLTQPAFALRPETPLSPTQTDALQLAIDRLNLVAAVLPDLRTFPLPTPHDGYRRNIVERLVDPNVDVEKELSAQSVAGTLPPLPSTAGLKQVASRHRLLCALTLGEPLNLLMFNLSEQHP